MKRVWCPKTALKVYIEAVKALSGRDDSDINVAEVVAALAGGWKAQVIVEILASCDSTSATSLGLSVATKQMGGRHVRIMEASTGDHREILVGEAEEVMREVEEVDFMVVDFRRSDAERLMRGARAGARGMVVVCTNVSERRGSVEVGNGMRVVRSAYLPIGRGLEILHVGVGRGPKFGSGGSRNRWIKHVDRVTGEEHLFRNSYS